MEQSGHVNSASGFYSWNVFFDAINNRKDTNLLCMSDRENAVWVFKQGVILNYQQRQVGKPSDIDEAEKYEAHILLFGAKLAEIGLIERIIDEEEAKFAKNVPHAPIRHRTGNF